MLNENDNELTICEEFDDNETCSHMDRELDEDFVVDECAQNSDLICCMDCKISGTCEFSCEFLKKSRKKEGE